MSQTHPGGDGIIVGVVVVVVVDVVLVLDLRVDDDVEVDAVRNGRLATTVHGVWPKGSLSSGSTSHQRAIEFLALVGDMIGDIPKGHAERADQLVQSTESVVRNIVEGAGRWSEADSAKHDKIARGEAWGNALLARSHEAPEARDRATLRDEDSAPRRGGRDVDEDDLGVNDGATRSTSSSTLKYPQVDDYDYD